MCSALERLESLRTYQRTDYAILRVAYTHISQSEKPKNCELFFEWGNRERLPDVWEKCIALADKLSHDDKAWWYIMGEAKNFPSKYTGNFIMDRRVRTMGIRYTTRARLVEQSYPVLLGVWLWIVHDKYTMRSAHPDENNREGKLQWESQRRSWHENE